MSKLRNPMKLLDAAADSISSFAATAVSKVSKGPSVTDRISSLMKKDEDSVVQHTEGEIAVESLRAVVSSELTQTPDEAVFTVTLCDKKTNEHLISVRRPWSECERVSGFLRSMFPKLEVPHTRSAKGSVALLIEDRRKHVQGLINAAIGHPAASKTKELQELCGYKELLSNLRGGETGSSTGPLEPPPTTHSKPTPARPPPPLATPPAPSQSAPFGERVPKPKPSVELTPEERQRIDECFRLIDVDMTGLVTKEELLEFIDQLSAKPSNATLERLVNEADKEKSGTFDNKTFAHILSKLSSTVDRPVQELISGYKSKRFAQLYEVTASSSPSPLFEPAELKALKFFVKTSGLRHINQDEVDKADGSLPLTLGDFSEIMSIFTMLVPLDEVFKALGKRRGKDKFIQLINRYAVKQLDTDRVRQLQEKIGASGSHGVACQKCAASQKEMERLLAQVEKLQNDNQRLKSQNEKLTTDLSEARSQVEALSDSTVSSGTNVSSMTKEIEKLKEQLAFAETNEKELLERIFDLEAELDFEREREKVVSDSESSTSVEGAEVIQNFNTYFLNPSHLGSNERSQVVDRPGSLVYELPSSFAPLGLSFDMMVCGEGCEYIAARDADGKRSLALTVDHASIFAVGTPHHVNLVPKRWTRVVCRFFWDSSVFDLVIDDETVAKRVPMRDGGVKTISTLDVFPRDQLVICYANMFFFR
jgi:hypothetical protein